MFEYVVVALVSLGLLFFFGTSLGLLRLPDFYTRMHAAGKGDTLSSLLILIGLALYHVGQGDHVTLEMGLVSLKMILICIFIFIGSPTATHAIMKAGYDAGVPHWTKESESENT